MLQPAEALPSRKVDHGVALAACMMCTFALVCGRLNDVLGRLMWVCGGWATGVLRTLGAVRLYVHHRCGGWGGVGGAEVSKMLAAVNSMYAVVHIS